LQRGQIKSYLRNRPNTRCQSYSLRVGLDHTRQYKLDANGDEQRNIETFTSSSEPDSDPDPQVTERPDSERCVIYIRRSGNDGQSVKEQKRELKKKAKERGLKIVDIIIDDGKTGQNFERSGLKKVIEYIKSGQISYVLVDHVSRLGRSAPQTLYLFHWAQEEYDVEIITEVGRINVNQVEDLIQAAMGALVSHMSTQYRSRSALRSRITNFIDDKIWSAWMRSIPLGYCKQDDWIEPKQDEVDIVQDIFQHFVKNGVYRQTANHISNKYSDRLDDDLTGAKIKRIVSDKVYIGEPEIDIDAEWVDKDNLTVNDPNLQIIGSGRFDKAQNIVADIADDNSSADAEDTLTKKSATRKFSLFRVLASTPILRLHCPDCDNTMVKNGQRELDGSIKVHNYICPNCDTQRRWPYLDEYEDMRKDDSSDEDGSDSGDN
jgi:DNA invertase Pin-like site-specific DNA recombinase